MKENSKLKRRQFLANLLFAGGALTVCGLQSQAALAAEPKEKSCKEPDQIAQRDPKDDGWELPDDLYGKPKGNKDGWELPPDYKNPNPKPQPQPRPQPRPQPYPQPMGAVPAPQPDGGVRPPQVRGKVVAPRPRKP